jgi:hypothetical protein
LRLGPAIGADEADPDLSHAQPCPVLNGDLGHPRAGRPCLPAGRLDDHRIAEQRRRKVADRQFRDNVEAIPALDRGALVDPQQFENVERALEPAQVRAVIDPPVASVSSW